MKCIRSETRQYNQGLKALQNHVPHTDRSNPLCEKETRVGAKHNGSHPNKNVPNIKHVYCHEMCRP